ncbi:PGF-pre-PGF domain-containing protein [Haloferax sp. AS1]|uniref:PGF-pre-PGF domain-containing protein n=1 Tax=Haloferax sp. AS1 TaxID=2562277 RepID=UPI00165FCEE4|nr:PGF-pre-PGF domain-containing protein [Haloferax sp. AS1]MBC9986770.1 PGF-pre-PGF domain-containing protein [Haloferax sp. AS1]
MSLTDKLDQLQNHTRLLSVLLAAVVVVSVLSVASPASAITGTLDGDKSSVQKGNQVTLTVDIDLESGDSTPIKNHLIELEGPDGTQQSVRIDSSGGVASTQPPWLNSVTLVSNNAGYEYGPNTVGYGSGYSKDFGYGYGYGYGSAGSELTYELVIDTSNFDNGQWTVRFDTEATDGEYIPFDDSQTTYTFDVTEQSTNNNNSNDDDDDDDSSTGSSAGGASQSNTGSEIATSERATVETTGAAEVTVEDAPDGRSISVGIKSGSAGESVKLNVNKDTVDEQVKTSGGAVENVDVTFEKDSDFDMEVTYSSPDEPETGDEEISTSPTDDDVLGYINVRHSAPDDNLATVDFGFRVSEQQLGDRSPEDIALYRYHDGEWGELDTSFTEKVGDSYRFTAESPGLSVFAISKKNAMTTESNTTETTTAAPTETSTPQEEVTTTDESVETETETETTSTDGPGFSVALAVIALIAAALVGIHRRD